MICKKCGCDTLIQDGDWYKCANCGAVIFDMEVRLGEQVSPTKIVESIEQSVISSQKIENDDEGKYEKSKLRDAIEFCTPIIAAFIIAMLLKVFVFANAVVPTGSMLNTIQENDRIIANRLAYISSDPERYDIVIFKFPDDETQCYVKRIIGLPGETVEIQKGKVYVTTYNGEKKELDNSFVTNCIPSGDFGPFKVPENSYFMLGDNRNNSWDSRYWKDKYVSKDKIVGKVKFRYYPSLNKIQ